MSLITYESEYKVSHRRVNVISWLLRLCEKVLRTDLTDYGREEEKEGREREERMERASVGVWWLLK
jgi:hypothetical protein